MKAGAGLGAATFVLGLTYGALARAVGWGTAVPTVFSAAAFSSSAQFTLLTALGGGGGIVAAVAAATLINARYLPMGVAVSPSLHGGRLRRAVEAQALADASFATAHLGQGRFDRGRLIGATIPQWTGWVTGTIVGVLAAPSGHLLTKLGLDVVFPAFFLILAVEEFRRSRRAVAAGGLGAVLAAGLLLAVQPGLALLLATNAAGIGIVRPSNKHSKGAALNPTQVVGVAATGIARGFKAPMLAAIASGVIVTALLRLATG
jgi:4-azaleucine resistance transporter AzlC